MRALRAVVVTVALACAPAVQAELVTSVFNGRVPCVPVLGVGQVCTSVGILNRVINGIYRYCVGFGGAAGGVERADNAAVWSVKNATGQACPAPAGHSGARSAGWLRRARPAE